MKKLNNSKHVFWIALLILLLFVPVITYAQNEISIEVDAQTKFWISIAVPISIAILIAYIFKFKVQTRIEKTFENNYKAILKSIFEKIHSFDCDFKSIYANFEKEFEELSGTRGELFASKATNPQFKNFIKRREECFESRFNSLLEHYCAFSKDFQLYRMYLLPELLDDIYNYYSSTILYTNGLLISNYNHVSIGERRLTLARKIIDYLKKEKIDKLSKEIEQFVGRWEEYDRSTESNSFVGDGSQRD